MSDTWIWVFTLANMAIFMASATFMRWAMKAATKELDRAHDDISKLLGATERAIDEGKTVRIPMEGKVS